LCHEQVFRNSNFHRLHFTTDQSSLLRQKEGVLQEIQAREKVQEVPEEREMITDYELRITDWGAVRLFD
jgi:hypothetical protein